MSPLAAAPNLSNVSDRTRGKISRRLLPFLLLLYAIAFLDRANLGYAALDMTKELRFTGAVYGLGAGVFFLGYWLLEIPGAVLVERWSARKWISRIMISWGLIAMANGLIHTSAQFYTARLLLGIAEAGFFPGITVYFTHWFSASDRAKAVAFLLLGQPLSRIFGAPLSAMLLNIHWLAWSGWRWLLILEGVPAVLFGAVTFFYLTDRPRDAHWLLPEERDWIVGKLDQERRDLATSGSEKRLKEIFGSQIVSLTAIWFFYCCSANGLTFWMPKILQKLSGFDSATTTLISAVPSLIALPCCLFIGWSSDRTRERRWHAAGCLLLAAIGLAVLQWTEGVTGSVAALSVAMIGIGAFQAPFWSVSSSALTGTASAVMIGFISSFGMLGGFAGPYIIGFLSDRSASFSTGNLFMVGTALAAAAVMLCINRSSVTDRPVPSRDDLG